MKKHGIIFCAAITLTFLLLPQSAQGNVVVNGGFENAETPAYWQKENAAEATVEWATDEYRSPERSLKISDSGGSDAPAWVSQNMATLNWNPTSGIPANIEIEVGGWVKTQNVNTNPAAQDDKILLTFSFYSASNALIFDQPIVLQIPQTQPSVDWTEIKNDVPIVLPTDAAKLIIKFQFGANATGTVWLDDLFMRTAPGAAGWIGDLYNANFGVPQGWFFWKDMMSVGEKDYGIVTITDKYAHKGKYSLRVADTPDNPAEVVAISDRNPVQPNTEYLVKAWVKLEGVNPNPEKDVEKAVFFTVTYHSSAEGWAETHGQDFFVVDQSASDRDWTLYSFRLKTGENDTRLSIRARMQHQAVGNTYWDDIEIIPIAQVNPGFTFENAEVPAYWEKANHSGATVAWSDEVYRSPQRSLMISDASGDDEPMWRTKVNMATLNWNPTTGIPANIEIEVGGWVKTENVNANPTSDAQRIQLIYTFYDEAGKIIFDPPVVIPFPQSQASVDWTEIKNSSPIVLPVPAASMSIQFKFGAEATGTAWLDDIFMRTAPGAEGWIGDLYNANFGVPEGWFFWKDNMSNGAKDFGIVTITKDAAHTGEHSLLVADTADNPAEVVAISDRLPIKGGTLYTIEAWVKTEGVVTNPEKDVEKSIFFTVTYHTDAEGWAEIGGQDFFVIDQTVSDKDWTWYAFTLITPEDAKRMSIRARLQHQATGNVYWDDFAVLEGNTTQVNGRPVELPVRFELAQNYPNPFNPTTTIRFALAESQPVRLEIYNLLGEKVRTLLDGKMEAGIHSLTWDGRGDDGALLPSGNYFYVLSADKAKLTRRMTLLK
ncbi:MAG: carbohydrate binding domain-containing protein [candidate division KSB1 bacterium]|nr:carbohydrate binding domain-containing protein [candidate division KSB1 bacterium]